MQVLNITKISVSPKILHKNRLFFLVKFRLYLFSAFFLGCLVIVCYGYITIYYNFLTVSLRFLPQILGEINIFRSNCSCFMRKPVNIATFCRKTLIFEQSAN